MKMDKQFVTQCYKLKIAIDRGYSMKSLNAIERQDPSNLKSFIPYERIMKVLEKSVVSGMGKCYIRRCPYCDMLSIGPQSLCFACTLKHKKPMSLIKCTKEGCLCNPNTTLPSFNVEKDITFVCPHTDVEGNDYQMRSPIECILLPLYFVPGSVPDTKRSERLLHTYHSINTNQISWLTSINECSICFHRGEFQIGQAILDFLIDVKKRYDNGSMNVPGFTPENSKMNISYITLSYRGRRYNGCGEK